MNDHFIIYAGVREDVLQFQVVKKHLINCNLYFFIRLYYVTVLDDHSQLCTKSAILFPDDCPKGFHFHDTSYAYRLETTPLTTMSVGLLTV